MWSNAGCGQISDVVRSAGRCGAKLTEHAATMKVCRDWGQMSDEDQV
jgi:hypothetical protein